MVILDAAGDPDVAEAFLADAADPNGLFSLLI